MAFVFRVRVDAEGSSAASIEARFEDLVPKLEEALGQGVSGAVQQVIELDESADVYPWFKGRATYAPDISEHVDEQRGGLRTLAEG